MAVTISSATPVKIRFMLPLQTNQQEIQSKKSSLVAGLVGAFLGSLIGAVLWILIYKLGYIAGIAGAVTSICAMKGYAILGGHLDKKGVLGSVIIMFIAIFFANKFALDHGMPIVH